LLCVTANTLAEEQSGRLPTLGLECALFNIIFCAVWHEVREGISTCRLRAASIFP
jgi:hypothetical protein